jgi:riboflavin synthase
MFTGLVQTTGRLQYPSPDQLQITWAPETPAWVFQDIQLGDSIAVDGVCLTVTRILASGFWVDASLETLERTTLNQRDAGERRVNLEPSLRVGSKLGGHFVTGHVDGVGYLESSVQTGNAWEMTFRVSDPRVARYVVPKGSIAVNGVSLTVADCSTMGDRFSVAVIPLTYAETNLSDLVSGDGVNLEGDVLGKYVEKFLRLASESTHSQGRTPHEAALSSLNQTLQAPASEITPAFLAEHGYGG